MEYFMIKNIVRVLCSFSCPPTVVCTFTFSLGSTGLSLLRFFAFIYIPSLF